MPNRKARNDLSTVVRASAGEGFLPRHFLFSEQSRTVILDPNMWIWINSMWSSAREAMREWKPSNALARLPLATSLAFRLKIVTDQIDT
jgi:hypothetical protein